MAANGSCASASCRSALRWRPPPSGPTSSSAIVDSRRLAAIFPSPVRVVPKRFGCCLRGTPRSCEPKMIPKPGNQRGFTLIELMVVTGLSTVVIGLIVATLISQQKNHITQDALVDMQQSLRAAMEVMGGDLQMAGYDPTGNAGATFLIADRAELQFQMDRNG